MATTVETKTTHQEVKDLRDQIEVAILQRIQASVAQASAAELLELLRMYQEVVTSDWYSKR